MVNFKRLADKAKDVVDKRGGTESLKEDLDELRGIAKGEGSLKDKAMEAKDAVKDPGAPGQEAQREHRGGAGAQGGQGGHRRQGGRGDQRQGGQGGQGHGGQHGEGPGAA
jgi:hypothetical protein